MAAGIRTREALTRTWVPNWVDVLISLVVLAVGVAEELANLTGHTTSLLWLGSVLVASSALLFRRRAPLTVLAVIVVNVLAVHNPPGSLESLTAWQFYALVVATFAVGAHAPISRSLPALAATLAVVISISSSSPSFADQASVAVPLSGVWAIGVGVRHLLGRTRRLEVMASDLVATGTQATEQAVTDERARIARELHDIVAHNDSIMVLQIGGVRHRLPPEQAAEIAMLQAAEDSGRATVEELHAMLGLLRPAGGDPLSPAPSLARLDELIDPVRLAGRRVNVSLQGDVRPLPTGLDLSAYRIVQEALTNSIKHAPGATTDIVLTYGSDDLEVLVHDDGGERSGSRITGHGLVGIRERVSVLKGQVEIGPRSEGGFAVRALLPIRQLVA